MPKKGLVILVLLIVLSALLPACTLIDTAADSEVAKAVVDRFFTAMENEDAGGMADLLDESFYTENEITREQFIGMMQDNFQEGQFSTLKPTYTVARVNGVSGHFELFLDVDGVEQGEAYSVQAYFIFDLVKTGTKWLIANFVQSTPDEQIIWQRFDAFLAAMQDEDLTALESLLSDNYNDGVYTTRDEYLAYLAQLFGQIQINSYTMEYWSALWTNDFQHVPGTQVSAIMTMDITEPGFTGERTVVFGLRVEKANGKWLIGAALMSNMLTASESGAMTIKMERLALFSNQISKFAY